MTNKQSDRFLGHLHDCYFGSDPRVNHDLAEQLNGKNIVIAGAGRGIGKACAELLSHGVPKSLSLVALEQDELDETAQLCKSIHSSIAIKTRPLDVTDSLAVQNFLSEVEQEFGGIDVLLMNAGRPPQWLPVSEGDADIWWDTVDVSLRGAYNFSHFALPTMQRQNGGRIIFTSSAGAHANRGVSSYIVAKLGMVRLAEIIHAENFEKHNVKAFAIHPGNVATRFFHDFKDKAEGHTKERSYLKDGRESEERSAQNATNFFKDATWDTPYMAAGMVCVLSSGQLDFMSGRYVDCSLKVEGLVEQSKSIVQNDLYRVRLHAAEGKLIPNLNF